MTQQSSDPLDHGLIGEHFQMMSLMVICLVQKEGVLMPSLYVGIVV